MSYFLHTIFRRLWIIREKAFSIIWPPPLPPSMALQHWFLWLGIIFGVYNLSKSSSRVRTFSDDAFRKKIQKRKHKKSSRLPWRDDVTLFSQHNQSQMTQRLLLSSKSSPLNLRAEQSPCYLFFHSQSSCITCGFSKPKRMRPGIFLSIFWAI